MNKVILSIYLIVFFISCVDKNNYIRDVYVNIEIPINQPEYSDLDAIGNTIFITGGVKGILIYHSNVNDYRAFDRNCSYEPSSDCAFIDSVNSTIASCSCCTSMFLIDQDGIPANGPALLPLKEYRTTLSGGILKIKN
ncbi:MAG: hypothetical protein CMD22_05645 [Flavobacteriales bacterium]|nr:hypothetical protein [Flavobacteriales bacterium]|tara:strand:+ start:1927 stop:2340 length:414 start_codon:yes stop_codon:yes gene_type:complete